MTFDHPNVLEEHKYLYQGKEFQNELGLDTYDFEWRMYNPAIARTFQVDPHADSYFSLSPYSWVANNPLRFIDPDGRDFVPGGGAFGGDLYNGAEMEELLRNMQMQFGNQQDDEDEKEKERKRKNEKELYANNEGGIQNGKSPQWDLNRDGKLSFGEADGWYKWGKGQPVHIRLKNINLSSISVADFESPDFFKEGHPGIYVRFDGKHYVNRNQALVYGTIGVVLVHDNIVMSLGDVYDFDIKNKSGTFKRDFATILGQHVAGHGTPFPIHITGTTTIRYK